jgi:hypothetical protein
MKTFEEKVRSMTSSDIIMAMVESLVPPPLIKIDMETFGGVFKEGNKKVCFGCAATNTICKIAKKKFNTRNITERETRASYIKSDRNFLYCFEWAIDGLRKGNIRVYNNLARAGNFELIKNIAFENNLPRLHNNYTVEDLQPYIKLAQLEKNEVST